MFSGRAPQYPVPVGVPVIKTSLFPEGPGTNYYGKTTRAKTHNSEVMRASGMLRQEMVLVSWAGAVFCCCLGHDEA
jgi:hypothetical protein